jgi:subfamily B ATP-binding cassette protein MsbA
VVAAAAAAYAYLSGPLLALLLGARGSAATHLGPAAELLPASALVSGAGGQASSVTLWWLAGALVALAALKGLAQLAHTALIVGAVTEIGRTLRARVYAHMLGLPLAAHRRQTRGDLLARLLDDVTRVEQAMVQAPLALVREGLAAAALLLVVIALAPRLALLAVVTLPPIALVIAAVGRRVRRSAEGGQRALGDFARRAEQGLASLRELKSFGVEDEQAAQVARAAGDAARFARRQQIAKAFSPLFNEVSAALALGAVLIYAGGLVSQQRLPAAALVSFFTALLLLYRPLKAIGGAVSTLAAGRASVERVAEILALPTEHEGQDVRPQPAALALEQGLELRGLGFRYGEDQPWVLRELELTLRPGELTVVRGDSGAGKSTLVDLLCGLERPAEGELRWDGQDLTTAQPRELRARVALVPQQPLLLPGSLAENLRCAAPGASEEQLWAALGAAGLGERCRGLEGGLAEQIGPGSGSGLSVGEVQRLAIARALLRERSVIVLDEPSAALDAAQEARLCETLRALRSDRALLVVSHREALWGGADQLLVLRDGALRAG